MIAITVAAVLVVLSALALPQLAGQIVYRIFRTFERPPR